MADQKLYYDQDQIDTIRYWQQQMQEEELGGMGYENFVEKHGPVFASQVEMMGKKSSPAQNRSVGFGRVE